MTDASEKDGTYAHRAGSDIAADSWILRLSPAPLRPYLKLARADRPIGTWLLLFPCWWSLALAAAANSRWPDWYLMTLFALGALIMRAAGCTINDMADRDIDARVARTATRPLASGQLSLLQAAVFLALLLAAGLAILLQLNGFAVALGASSLLLVAAYPFMKRITYWPQAWLGLTFNWGALLGWAAVEGTLALPAILLYLGGIAWTLGYDTIYAHQDKEDDALVGVKSTALRFGTASKTWISLFYALAALLFLAAGLTAGLAWPYLVGVLLVALQLGWQVRSLDIADPGLCLRLFKSNRFTGWLLLAGILAAKALG
jgi:4-hydroxybenzoate polyprenyltransferase